MRTSKEKRSVCCVRVHGHVSLHLHITREMLVILWQVQGKSHDLMLQAHVGSRLTITYFVATFMAIKETNKIT